MVKLLAINLENSGKNSTFLLLGKFSVHCIYMHLQGKFAKNVPSQFCHLCSVCAVMQYAEVFLECETVVESGILSF